MEKWDILSPSGEPTGETVVKGMGVLKPDQYHLVVHIWIVDKRKRVLIQQRSSELEIMPGKWAITGGSAISGENQISAALRELHEEVGIKADEGELTLIKKYRGRNDFVYVYVVHKDIDLSKIEMQHSEVQAVKWVTVPELKKMVHARLFHNYCYLRDIYTYVGGEE